ncbi:MAG: LamB/YcsF family protein [Vicinamibacteria bacterium]
MVIDLNGDVGEGFGDEAFLPLLTSANIACGFHAGDPQTMDRTVALAKRHGVAVGAHPGYDDLRGFGRRPVQASPAEIEADVLYQIAALAGFARAHGVELVHVKPHGALYNQAASDPGLASAIARAVAGFSRELVLVGLATSSTMREAAEAQKIRFAGEAFADRIYNPDGTLQSRKIAGSVIGDPKESAAQAVSIARDGKVKSHDGSEVTLSAETLGLHGDNPSAVRNAQAVREALLGARIELRALAVR